MTQTTDSISAIVAEAIQPAGTRKPIYELRLTNPQALRSAARRAYTAQTIIARIHTDDPYTRAAVEALDEALTELQTAAELNSPDEFGDYDGDGYAAGDEAQSRIESAAAQLSDPSRRPVASRTMHRLDAAAELAGMIYEDAYQQWRDAGLLEAIGGIYYIAEQDIPQPPTDDDDPPPSGASEPTYGQLEFSDAYLRERAAAGIEIERRPSSAAAVEAAQSAAHLAAVLSDREPSEPETYSAEAAAIWSASLSSPQSRRPLRHRSRRELYDALQGVFAAIEPVDDIVRRMDGAESIAELTTAEYVLDPSPNEQGETIAEYRDRAADAIETICEYLRKTPKPQPPSDDDPSGADAPAVANAAGASLSETAARLRSLADGSAADVRGAFGTLSSVAGVERRAELVRAELENIPPAPITAAAIAAYIPTSRYEHDFSDLDTDDDARKMTLDYLYDAECAAAEYRLQYGRMRREMLSKRYADEEADNESGAHRTRIQAHDAILLLAAAIEHPPIGPEPTEPSSEPARAAANLTCPECGSTDIGRGAITGDPFCRECQSSAVAGADGIWQGVTRQLAAELRSASRPSRPSIERPYVDADVISVEDDDPIPHSAAVEFAEWGLSYDDEARRVASDDQPRAQRQPEQQQQAQGDARCAVCGASVPREQLTLAAFRRSCADCRRARRLPPPPPRDDRAARRAYLDAPPQPEQDAPAVANATGADQRSAQDPANSADSAESTQ